MSSWWWLLLGGELIQGSCLADVGLTYVSQNVYTSSHAWGDKLLRDGNGVSKKFWDRILWKKRKSMGFSIWKHWILRHTQTMVIFEPENTWLEPPQTALSIWVLECQAGSQKRCKSCSDRSSCFARVWNKSQKNMKIIKFRGLFFFFSSKFLQSPDGVCSKTSWGTGLVAAKTLARKGDFNRWSGGGMDVSPSCSLDCVDTWALGGVALRLFHFGCCFSKLNIS